MINPGMSEETETIEIVDITDIVNQHDIWEIIELHCMLREDAFDQGMKPDEYDNGKLRDGIIWTTQRLEELLEDMFGKRDVYFLEDEYDKDYSIFIVEGETLPVIRREDYYEPPFGLCAEDTFGAYASVVQKLNRSYLLDIDGIHIRWETTQHKSFKNFAVFQTVMMQCTGDKVLLRQNLADKDKKPEPGEVACELDIYDLMEEYREALTDTATEFIKENMGRLEELADAIRSVINKAIDENEKKIEKLAEAGKKKKKEEAAAAEKDEKTRSMFQDYLVRIITCCDQEFNFLWDENAEDDEKRHVIYYMTRQLAYHDYEKIVLYNNANNTDPDNPRPRQDHHIVGELPHLIPVMEKYHESEIGIMVDDSKRAMGAKEDCIDEIIRVVSRKINAYENRENVDDA